MWFDEGFFLVLFLFFAFVLLLGTIPSPWCLPCVSWLFAGGVEQARRKQQGNNELLASPPSLDVTFISAPASADADLKHFWGHAARKVCRVRNETRRTERGGSFVQCRECEMRTSTMTEELAKQIPETKASDNGTQLIVDGDS